MDHRPLFPELKLKKECRIGDMSLNRLRFNSESELRIALLSRQGHRNQPMKNDYNPVHIHYTRFSDFNGMGTLQSTNLVYGGLTQHLPIARIKYTSAMFASGVELRRRVRVPTHRATIGIIFTFRSGGGPRMCQRTSVDSNKLVSNCVTPLEMASLIRLYLSRV